MSDIIVTGVKPEKKGRHKASAQAITTGFGNNGKRTNRNLLEKRYDGNIDYQETPVKKSRSKTRKSRSNEHEERSNKPTIINPPLSLKRLEEMVDECPTLAKCLRALATNVGGRGYTLHPRIEINDEMDPNIRRIMEEEKQYIVAFLSRIWPKRTCTQLFSILVLLRNWFGHTYWEVLRNKNAPSLIAAVNPIEDNKTMRLCKKDAESREINYFYRLGTDIEKVEGLDYNFRRFVQVTSTRKKTYFKEFGDPRDLNKETGEYGEPGTIAADKLATEIFFWPMFHPSTEYGLPKHVPAIIDILSARSAKETNLDILDNAATPPLAIIVTGTRDANLKEQIEDQLRLIQQSGQAATKALILTLEPEDMGTVPGDEVIEPKIVFERLSDLVMKEGMFLDFLKYVEKEVIGIFCIPPLLLGDIEKTPNKATAEIAKMIAEEQVFAPARKEIEDIFNDQFLIQGIIPPGKVRGHEETTGVQYWEFKLNPLGTDRVESVLKILKEALAQAAISPDQAQAVIFDLLSKMGDYKLEQHELEEMSIPLMLKKAPTAPKPNDEPQETGDRELANLMTKALAEHNPDLYKGLKVAKIYTYTPTP